MRILHTGNTYHPSLDGVAEIVRHVSEILAQRGHDVHVATSAVGSKSSYENLRGVHVHRFPVKGNLTLGMTGEVQRYRDFVRSGNWDILVNHCVAVWLTDAILDEIRDYPWPSILVTQGLGLNNPGFEKYYLTLPRYLPSYHKWVRVSNVSEELSFANKFNIPVPPVITNGVDLKEWGLPPLGVRQAWGVGRKLWIVNVSNHNPFKGHRTFFRLADRLPATGARITLIGGTYPMRKWGLGRLGITGGCSYECRSRAILSRAVDLRMNLPRAQVTSAIKEADVLVSTSNWEANSVLLLESMAAGTPWVSFDVGSARENAGGIVVNTMDEMGNAVTQLLKDPDRRRSLGREGRIRAKEKHDWVRVVDQYERLYERAVGQRGLECLPSTK
jgi:glycosyltransferase involved in cell wall biosynthesis